MVRCGGTPLYSLLDGVMPKQPIAARKLPLMQRVSKLKTFLDEFLKLPRVLRKWWGSFPGQHHQHTWAFASHERPSGVEGVLDPLMHGIKRNGGPREAP